MGRVPRTSVHPQLGHFSPALALAGFICASWSTVLSLLRRRVAHASIYGNGIKCLVDFRHRRVKFGAVRFGPAPLLGRVRLLLHPFELQQYPVNFGFVPSV